MLVYHVDQLRAGFAGSTGRKWRHLQGFRNFDILVRDQEVEGSNPFAPTILFLSLMHLRYYAAAVSVSEFVAHVAQTTLDSEFEGNSKPSPSFSAHC